jgi:hypothetical protein
MIISKDEAYSLYEKRLDGEVKALLPKLVASVNARIMGSADCISRTACIPYTDFLSLTPNLKVIEILQTELAISLQAAGYSVSSYENYDGDMMMEVNF